MKNLKIFPKMFCQTFAILGILIVLIHLFVFFYFPRTYLAERKKNLQIKANELAHNMQYKDLSFIEKALDFYSQNSEIKAFIKSANNANEIALKPFVKPDSNSSHNSLLIEERTVVLKTAKKIVVQFVSSADMQKDAKNLSIGFLPYSLLISIIFSMIISLIYAKVISFHINEIKKVTLKMQQLDRKAYLPIHETNEIGQLKSQINDLYFTLLKAMDDLAIRNKEVLRLEKLKYDFFRASSHELKTPLASLKIILENMKYNIISYQDKDKYIDRCIVLIDDLSRHIKQILSVTSIENFKDDEEVIVISNVLDDILKKYDILAKKRNIRIHTNLKYESIYIGQTALKVVLSNLISNAVKYTDENGSINISVKKDWLYIENTYCHKDELELKKLFNINFNLNKENSNGLGLYIIKNILMNYGIAYKMYKSKIGIIFAFRLSAEKNNI